MEVETLRWLVAVADGQTLAEAAQANHTTQPAVTRGLHRLAAHFGVALTERSGRRLRLTFAGEIVATSARQMLEQLDTARRAVAEANDPDSGTVQLGFLNPLGAWLVPRLLLDFHLAHPRVRFELRHEGVARNLQALVDGELDLLLTVDPGRPDVNFEPLFIEAVRIAVGRNHRLAQRSSVKFAELTDEAWVLFPPGHGLRQQVDELARAAGFSPRQTFEGQDLATLFALIGAGSGVGLFASNPPPPPSVRQLELDPPLTRSVGLASVPGRTAPGSVAAFADFVRAFATGIDPAQWEQSELAK